MKNKESNSIIPYDIIIIGGGAAGFFAAGELAKRKPGSQILMLEKSGKVLSKVKISGGGRCNVTHNCPDPEKLLQFYPRGNPWLQGVFSQFSVKDTIEWFENRGVMLKAESDGRMFPISNNSQTIVDALIRTAHQNPGFSLHLGEPATSLQPSDKGYQVATAQGTYFSPIILLCAGGQPSLSGQNWLSDLKLNWVAPVPSLFTFNTKPHPWAHLQGISLNDTHVSLPEFDLHFRGPFLVTHWGFSGPAVLKLSAFAARHLAEKNYHYLFSIDFCPDKTQKELEGDLAIAVQDEPTKKPVNHTLFSLPKNLWVQLCQESGLDQYHNWAESGKKARQKMAILLKSRPFQGNGKTTFKDEFVTAGGIDLQTVDPFTCQLNDHPGIFVAGEILDVDGITGGFNFQAAWSTSAVAVKEICLRLAQI